MKPLNNTVKGSWHHRERNLGLLAGWGERLDRAEESLAKDRVSIELPRSAEYYSKKVRFIDTAEGCRNLVQLAEERPISHIGIDTEFKFSRSPIRSGKRGEISDPRSIQPLLLSLALVEPTGDSGGELYTFVVDLRNPEILAPLQRLFAMPIPFVGHFLKVELFCLWQLDLMEPRTVWDTWAHEKVKYLGAHHHYYKQGPRSDDADNARAKDETKEDDRFRYTLLATCLRHELNHSFAGDKERLQKTFLSHREDTSFTQEQIDYAAEDAIAAASLYPRQVLDAASHGLVEHLTTVEMPWVISNAWIEWNGVRIDPNKKANLIKACRLQIDELESRVRKYGLENCRSHKQVKDFFQSHGILDLFRRNGSYSFDKDQLGKFQDRHPSIALVRATRRAHDLLSDKILSNELIGNDGRVHPQHGQLGAHTGRQTSKHPNILGLDRVLRPLIIPDKGNGIGEIDWSQIEIGIAAAIYGDDRLVEMFNCGDVYSKMAQSFFLSELLESDLSLTTSDFKKQHPTLRNRMKACTLGIIYGMTSFGLARYLSTNEREAATLQKRFLDLFPGLGAGLKRSVCAAATRGYATTVSGLRRHRGNLGQPTSWERNWMTNHPVQGSGAVLLKVAGNRLRKLYLGHGAKIIVPFHDSIVFECPLEQLDEVVRKTADVMCSVVQEYFPQLRPKVDVNVSDPSCWNKDGHSDSIDLFAKDLTFHLDRI